MKVSGADDGSYDNDIVHNRLAILAWFVIAELKPIGDYQVGIVTKRMFGGEMPQGQVVARNGEVGVQADILMPGLYWRIPIIWKIQKWIVTEILPTEVGVIESIDGMPIPKDRLLVPLRARWRSAPSFRPSSA